MLHYYSLRYYTILCILLISPFKDPALLAVVQCCQISSTHPRVVTDGQVWKNIYTKVYYYNTQKIAETSRICPPLIFIFNIFAKNQRKNKKTYVPNRIKGVWSQYFIKYYIIWYYAYYLLVPHRLWTSWPRNRWADLKFSNLQSVISSWILFYPAPGGRHSAPHGGSVLYVLTFPLNPLQNCWSDPCYLSHPLFPCRSIGWSTRGSAPLKICILASAYSCPPSSYLPTYPPSLLTSQEYPLQKH